MFLERSRLLVVTLWVGSLWTVGYLVAPTLFATLADRALAGLIAGRMFRIEAWLSLACGIALIALCRLSSEDGSSMMRNRVVWIAAGMLMCTLVGYFGLQPFMAALRETAGPDGMMDAAIRSRFGMLHGVASLIYLVQSLLGVLLIIKLR